MRPTRSQIRALIEIRDSAGAGPHITVRNRVGGARRRMLVKMVAADLIAPDWRALTAHGRLVLESYLVNYGTGSL